MNNAARKATSERMKSYHARMRAEKLARAEEAAREGYLGTVEGIETVDEAPAEGLIIEPDMPKEPQGETISSQDDVSELKRQIEELKTMQWQLMAQTMGNQQQGGAQVGVNGMTGTVDRFDMNFDLYPDPSERLEKEQKLQRFAFQINYELEFKVSESAYTTIDNVRMREPKFTLELVRIVMDEDTGDPTDGRYSVARLTLHEDPDTALFLAREMGMQVDRNDEMSFLNEMRYIRMRDWLLDCFYPPKPETKTQRRQTVIGGRLVDYWEKNTEGGTGITKEQWDRTPKIKF